MKRLTYIGAHDAIEAFWDAQIIERGQTVEVEDDLAERLLEQDTNWKAAAPAKTKEGNA